MARSEDAAARRWRPRPRATHGWDRRRTPKNTTGLDSEHRAERARQLEQLSHLPRRPCRRCTQPMYHPDRCPHGPCPACTLHLGHLIDRALGGGREGRDLEHAHCNVSAGARLGQRMAARAARATTRDW